jgi:hypothetical protein
MLLYGVSVEETARNSEELTTFASQLAQSTWEDQIRQLLDIVTNHVMPSYLVYADAARARGKDHEEQICLHMIKHELAQAEFARRELTGSTAEHALEPVVEQLKYPLRT